MLFKKFIVNLPTSKLLSYYWNFGSLLGMILVFQIITGVFLVFFFSNDSLISFNSVQYIMYEVNFGWIFRLMHFNGASFFFFFLYLHFFKALFMMSYRLKLVWIIGLLIFLLLMMEAFLGYVLVWAQMSFWACVVITSLFSVIPIYGFKMVFWIWGGFSVSGATLKFFFVLHFLVPWFVLFLVVFHLSFLHSSGSTSKLFCHSGVDKINFFPFYWMKDFINLIVFFVFFLFVFFFPFILGDPEMFLEADSLTSPVHIVPEWYFLFAYAILRAIPNKFLGVFFLVFSIFVFFFFVLLINFKGIFCMLNKFLFSMFFFVSFFLSWLGQCLVEEPFILLSYIFSFLYFFILFFFMGSSWFFYILF